MSTPVNNVQIRHVRTYFNKGKIVAPSIEELERKYSSVLEKMLASKKYICHDVQDHNVQLGNVRVESKFHKDYIDVDVSYPVYISGKSIQADMGGLRIRYKINVRMGHIYNVVMQVLERFKENQEKEVIYFAGVVVFNNSCCSFGTVYWRKERSGRLVRRGLGL